MSRLTSKFKNMGSYWKFENAILDSAPLYFINTNGLFIITNDEDLAVNHADGYASKAISSKEKKAAKKSGFMYAHVDIAETLNRFPTGVLNPRQEEIVQSLKGKSGQFDLTSSKTTDEMTKFNLQYSFEGSEATGKHLLDLINSIYVVTTFNP